MFTVALIFIIILFENKRMKIFLQFKMTIL